jgi:hypothetical protein
MSLLLSSAPPPGGALIRDLSPFVRSCHLRTNKHGVASLETDLDIQNPYEAFSLYQLRFPHLALYEHGALVGEGRVEDPAMRDLGGSLRAMGYQNALRDAPYSALWSSTSVAGWEPILTTDVAGRAPDMYVMDTQNRLFIGLTKNTTYTNNGTTGDMTTVIPDASNRRIVACSFDYTILLPAGWSAILQLWNNPFSFQSNAWTLAATGVLQTGASSLTFTGCDRISFVIFNSTGAPYTFAGENGSNYLRITNLRFKTTTSANVAADEIVKDVRAAVSALNSGQLAATDALIAATGLDLTDEGYEDQYGADILDHLAMLGDSQNRRWRWSVENGRVLRFDVEASGRTWYVDAASIELEGSTSELANSAYGVYQQASGGRKLRTATNTDAVSVAQYGLTRRIAVPAQTTSAATAGLIRDTALADRKVAQPRVGEQFEAVYDGAGARWPIWMVRGGDTITLRNPWPGVGATVDRIRTFIVDTTDYDAMTRTIEVTPASPLPTLDVLLARREEGIRT